MAENGVRSVDLPQAAVVDEVIGNRDGGTVNIKVDNFAQQMLGSGPIATEMAVLSSQITSGRVSQPTWAKLVLITPPDDGTGGEVLESDEGSHTDPVTALVVNNSGTYAWRASTPGWERIGDIGLAGKLNKAANLGDVEDPVAARENLEVTSSGKMNALLDGKADRDHGHGIGDVTALQSTLDGKADSGHGHGIVDVAGLQPALDGKSDSDHGHGIGDVTALQSTLDGKADSGHGHSIGNVVGLQQTLDGKSDSGHGHSIDNVAGLQPALDGKSDSGHGHGIGDVTGLQSALDGQLKSSDNLAAVADPAVARANLGAASAAQGAKADSALQAADVAAVASSASADDLVEGQSVQLMTLSEREKIGRLSVLTPLDLDALVAKVDGLEQAVVLKGDWDASGGGFPGAGLAQVGWTYIASTAGTVDGVVFSVNDRVISLADNASTTTYAGNWLKVDYTDQVLSVAGKSGAVSLVKGDVGLGSVDNTPDSAKPVSVAQQAALDGKANAADMSGHTGNVANPHSVTKGDVGLGAVDNTPDSAKPVSAAQQAALDGKARIADLSGHTGNAANPHSVGKAQVGLGAVDDTADADKPVSVAHVTGETNQRGFHTGNPALYGFEATDADGNVVQRLRMSDGEIESLANRRLWSLGAEENARGEVADTASIPPRFPGAFGDGTVEALTPVLVDEDDRAVLALEDGFIVQQARKAFANGSDQFEGLAFTSESGHVLGAFDEAGTPVMPVRVGFHSGAAVSDFAMTDNEGRVLIGWNSDGETAIPGFDPLTGLASLPKSQTEAQTPNFLWSNNGELQTRPDWDGLYTQTASQVYSSLAEYMAYWEALRTEAPDYVTRTQLATDADSNPIWAYEFNPSRITVDVTEVDEDAVQQPQIVFVGGTHSAEKAALVSNLLFAQNLVRNWRTLPGYERIRWGCRLVMIPTIVPYGTDNNQNYNINDVDINRNGVGWDLALGEPGGAFRGPSQFSEIESQLAFDLPTTHFPDAVAFVDHHNGAGVDPDTGVDYAVWVGTIRDDGVRLAREHLANVSSWVMREMQPSLTDNHETVFLTQNNYGTIGRGWQTLTTDPDPGRDKLGFLLETATTTSFFPGSDVIKSRRMGEQNILGFLNLLLERERTSVDSEFRAKTEAMLDGIGQGELDDGALLDLVLRFANDPDCGVYRNADNDWVLVAGGNDILRLKSAGATLVLESVTGDAIQSTTTDTTAGRLMGVGAFGLGAMGPAPSISDFTVELAAGFYRYLGGGAGATGSPDTGAWNGSCIVSRGVGERITFLAIRESASAPKMWMGVRSTDTGAITWFDVAFQDAVPAFTGLDLNGNLIGGVEVTIADDAVATITPPRKGGFVNVTSNGQGDFMQSVESGMFLFDVGSSPNVTDIYAGASISSSTSDVTGTTGLDGQVTFAVQADVVKIENRSGASRSFQVTFT